MTVLPKADRLADSKAGQVSGPALSQTRSRPLDSNPKWMSVSFSPLLYLGNIPTEKSRMFYLWRLRETAVRAQTARLLEKIRGIWLLEATPCRMATNHAGTKTDRVLAGVGVFHQALRDSGWHHIPGPTYLRIRETPLIADRVVGHAPENSMPLASRQPATGSSRTFSPGIGCSDRMSFRLPLPRLPRTAATILRNYSRSGVFTLSFAALCRGDGERQHQTQNRSVQSRTRRDRYAQVHGTSFGGSGIRHVHNRGVRGKQHGHPSSSRQAASQAAPSPSQVSQSASARYPSSLPVLTGNGFSRLTAFPGPACFCVLHLTLPAVTI